MEVGSNKTYAQMSVDMTPVDEPKKVVEHPKIEVSVIYRSDPSDYPETEYDLNFHARSCKKCGKLKYLLAIEADPTVMIQFEHCV